MGEEHIVPLTRNLKSLSSYSVLHLESLKPSDLYTRPEPATLITVTPDEAYEPMLEDLWLRQLFLYCE